MLFDLELLQAWLHCIWLVTDNGGFVVNACGHFLLYFAIKY